MRKTTMSVVGVASLAAALTLTACGGSGASTGSADQGAGSNPTAGSAASSTTSPAAGPTPTADGLLTDSTAAVSAATAVRLKGSMQKGGTSMTIDGVSDTAGTTVDLSLSSGSTGTVHIVMVGGQTYIQGDSAFWTKSGVGSVAAKASGKFVHMPAGTGAPSSQMNTIKLAGSIMSGIYPSQVDTIASKSVNGADAWVLTEKGGGGSIAFDKTTKLPIQLEGGSTDGQGTLTFSDWNKPVNVTAPAADQVVELTALMAH